MADLATLESRAASLAARAQALADAYNRATWYRFTAVFFPVPFVLLLLRLQVEYWHYYLFGTAYIVFSAALYAYDGRAADLCKSAEQKADAARRELDQARGVDPK